MDLLWDNSGSSHLLWARNLGPLIYERAPTCSLCWPFWPFKLHPLPHFPTTDNPQHIQNVVPTGVAEWHPRTCKVWDQGVGVGSGIKEGGKETLDRLQLVSQTHDTVLIAGAAFQQEEGPERQAGQWGGAGLTHVGNLGASARTIGYSCCVPQKTKLEKKKRQKNRTRALF